jgi:hypothetical protein
MIDLWRVISCVLLLLLLVNGRRLRSYFAKRRTRSITETWSVWSHRMSNDRLNVCFFKRCISHKDIWLYFNAVDGSATFQSYKLRVTHNADNTIGYPHHKISPVRGSVEKLRAISHPVWWKVYLSFIESFNRQCCWPTQYDLNILGSQRDQLPTQRYAEYRTLPTDYTHQVWSIVRVEQYKLCAFITRDRKLACTVHYT